MTTPILADAYGHHVWATIRIIDACLALEPAQLETTVPGTYGSIIETIRHTVGADCGYLYTLTDGRSSEIEEAELDLAALRAQMEANGPEWAALIAGDLDPDRDVVRHDDDGTDSHAPLGIRLAQALHHGTDHRSQVCTALTSLGLEPPAINAWNFAQQGGRLSVTPTAS